MEDLTPQSAQSSQPPQTQVPSTPEPKKLPWAIIIAAGILVLGLAFYFLGGSKLFRGFIGLTPDDLAGLNECVEGIPENGLLEEAVYSLEISRDCEVQFATTDESKAQILYNKIIGSVEDLVPKDPLKWVFNSINNLPNPTLSWSFGDGTTQEIEGNQIAFHTYTAAGEYIVTASAVAYVGEEEITLTATKIITSVQQGGGDGPGAFVSPGVPVETPDDTDSPDSTENDTPEITFLSSLWIDIFHADTAGLPDLVNPVTAYWGDAVTIMTSGLDETAENIIQIRFNNKQWDLDIHAEEAVKEKEEVVEEEAAEEDPVQKLKKMAETIADGGSIFEDLLIDESFSNYAAKFHSIEGFAKNSKAILEKLKQFLAENKDVITSHEFDQVQGLYGMIASLDSGLSQISGAEEFYSTKKFEETVNKEFLSSVLGFKEDSLQDQGCITALKNLQLTKTVELNEDGEVTITRSAVGIPTPCIYSEAMFQDKIIQMKKINGKYFPTYFSPGSKMMEVDVLADAANIFNPEAIAKIVEVIDTFASHFKKFRESEDKNPCKFAGETMGLISKTIEDTFEGEEMPPYFFESFTTPMNTPIEIPKSFLESPVMDGGEIKYNPLFGTVIDGHDTATYTPEAGYEGYDGFVYKLALLQDAPIYYLGKNKMIEDMVESILKLKGVEIEPVAEKDKDPKGMKFPGGGHVTNALYCVGVGKAADVDDEKTDIDDDIDSDIDGDSNDDDVDDLGGEVDDLGGDIDDLGGDEDDLGGDVINDGEVNDVVADGVVADGVVADGVVADGVVADGVVADGVVADGVVADGVVADGVVADGVVADDVVVDGDAADGGGGAFISTKKIPVNETAPEIKTGKVTTEDVLNKFTCLEKIENPSKFADTDDETVKLLASLGFKGTAIIQGFTDIGKPIFDGSAYTNRVEILKTLMVSSCTPFDLSLEDSDLFKDIQSEAWYTPYVGSARKQDIVEGYESGTYYRPAQMVTRMEAIKMMARISGIDKAQDSCEKKPFSDVSKSHWGYEISRDAFCGNVIAGKMIGEKRYLLPDAPMTRDEMAVFLYNFYVAEVGKADIL